jgi:uncharacterized protein YeeX (DUF496 family)
MAPMINVKDLRFEYKKLFRAKIGINRKPSYLVKEARKAKKYLLLSSSISRYIVASMVVRSKFSTIGWFAKRTDCGSKAAKKGTKKANFLSNFEDIK